MTGSSSGGSIFAAVATSGDPGILFGNFHQMGSVIS
jgi:hypothetical protein